MLGLSKARVKQLIRAEILKTWGGPPKIGARWWVGCDSINAIVGCGANASARTQIMSGEQSIDHLLRHRVHDEQTFLRLISAILSGDVEVVGTLTGRQGIRAWFVCQKQAEKILEPSAERVSADLSVVEASKKLGVKQEVTYSLIRCEILESYKIQIGKRMVRLVTNRALKRFSQNYILGIDLAAMFGTSPKNLVSYLSQRIIYPIAGPTVATNPCRQYCWRRSKKLCSLIAAMPCLNSHNP